MKKNYSSIAFALSVAAVVFSSSVSLFGIDLWLAGTQWMLISIVLGIWSLILKK